MNQRSFSVGGFLFLYSFFSLSNCFAVENTPLHAQPTPSPTPTISVLQKAEDKHVLVLLKYDSACTKCSGSSFEVKEVIRSQLVSQKIVPLWQNPNDFDLKSGESLIENQLTQLAKDKNVSGVLLVLWGALPHEDSDTAHGNETPYWLHSYFKMDGSSAGSVKKDIAETDSFVAVISQVVNDQLVELKNRAKFAQAQLSDLGQEDVLIEISGVQDFAHYSKIRNLIQSKLKESVLEDRRLSRGHVTFAISAKKNSEELKKELRTMSPEIEGNLSIQMEIR